MGMIGNSLAQGLISGANIQDGTVDTPDIKDSAVTAAKIASAVITPAKLSTGAPTWDTSGNLGLGVTPSAWGSAFKAIQVGAVGSAYVSSAGDVIFGRNTYNNGTNSLYLTSNYASAYGMISGQHQWYNAASGTAGNTITFIQAMTLDASGNLGVGTSSPSAKLAVSNAGAAGLEFSPTSGYLGGAYIQGFNRSTSVFTPVEIIASSIGFVTSSTERARIDSSGNLLVGTTSADVGLNPGIKLRPAGNGANLPIVSIVTGGSTNSTASLQYYSTGAGAYRFYVADGGTIYATSTTISAISDERLKENIKDIDTGLDAVMALKPRRFDWKEGKGQDKKNAAGFIAQEFETVFPASVGTSMAGEDGIEYKNICHEELIPTLVKAVQEQQAIIESLTERITALETQ